MNTRALKLKKWLKYRSMNIKMKNSEYLNENMNTEMKKT